MSPEQVVLSVLPNRLGHRVDLTEGESETTCALHPVTVHA